MRDANAIKYGKFSIAPANEVHGELHLAGKKTSLYLRDGEEFRTHLIRDASIFGTLHDQTRVTLIKCLTLEHNSTSLRTGERYYSAKLFPHFVLEGHRHLGPNDRAICEISFVIDDATALFYDFDAFSTIIDAAPYIEQLTTSHKLDRVIPTGPQPIISYFTGKREIIEVDTALGKFRARHNPRCSFGGPSGVRIDNTISVSLEPEDQITFNQAITRTLQLLRFFEVIIGRCQNLHELLVYVKDDKNGEPLKVHWSYCPSREADTEDNFSPQPADLLLVPIERSEEFACVMARWLEKDEERGDARQRFYNSFAQQRSYSIERLVGAANIFDILPAAALPNDIDLPEDVQEAKRRCRTIFEVLPESYERNSVLNALGRVGKTSLKHKTRHRASYLIDTIGERFPDLVLVLDEAINCRNHYVHGSSPKIDYNRNFDKVTFFTDTLEFVFAASELIESGWNIRTFIERGTTMTHPFGAYRVNYSKNLQALKALLKIQ